MPLRDDLLNPIPGANACGDNLRYAPVYDKIKEARREDDDAPQGEWQFERKTADFPLAIKLVSETLATKSKDLQLAVWLAEALLKQEGFSGFRAGLNFIQSLLATFWDGLYPEIEDGDASLRAVPLEWLGGRMDMALRNAPIVRKGLGWFKYKEALSVGREEDADTEAKAESRAAAIADGKLTGEEWDAAFASTPKEYYAALEADLDGILETVESLGALCEEKFGDDAPSFSPLRNTTEELRHTVHGLLQKKRELFPDEPAPAAGDGWSTAEEAPVEAASEQPAMAAPARPKPRGGPLAAEPVDRADACERVVSAARFLRTEDCYNPAPYLLLRGLRWGELRAAGSSLDASVLEPPPTEIRQALKQSASQYEWQQVLDLSESAMALPCGRGWLDVQRYAVRAATELGYDLVATAIRSALNALLADYPGLSEATLLDDTPAANQETRAWLKEIAPAAPSPALASYEQPAEDEGGGAEAGFEKPPDAYDLAQQALRNGDSDEALDILLHAADQERSGRGRFQRRLQLAEVCLASGHARVAQPVLEQLTAEIDDNHLESWESPALTARAFALLYRCLDQTGAGDELRQKAYDRVCRLDARQAILCAR
ncbi:MAG: type VI secretion system protein TssA [Bryobacteraceae bacterium]|nr:type VI secretion system protein TssA [Bryobacteraceae bacterium]